MTFQQFLDKWNNKYISILNPGKQCFDLVVAWTDNLQILHFPNNPSPFPYEYASQIYTNFNEFQAKYFDRIENGLFNSPQAGDIVIWKPGYNGGAGHTGVATGENTFWTFDCFVQNDPLGSKCYVKTYNYGYLSSSGIYGWLRPKVNTPNADQYVNAAKEAITSARNNTNTGSQIGDPEFKNKMQFVVEKAQEVINLVKNSK